MAPRAYFRHRRRLRGDVCTIEVELATRILVPKPDGSTKVRFLSSARLRCSPNAAANLRASLEAALKLLEHPQPDPVAASKLN